MCAHQRVSGKSEIPQRDPFADRLLAVSDISDAVAGADLVVPVLPSHALRAVIRMAEPISRERICVLCVEGH